jgi:hypothetical protein
MEKMLDEERQIGKIIKSLESRIILFLCEIFWNPIFCKKFIIFQKTAKITILGFLS